MPKIKHKSAESWANIINITKLEFNIKKSYNEITII